MSQFIYFTPEEKARAQNTDLVSLLRAQGERPVRSGREFRTPNDPSITVRGNKWFDHSARVGGYAVSFVQRYYRLPYQEAVLLLLGRKNRKTYEQAKPVNEVSKAFALPEPYGTMRRMYAYLMRQRHIDREVISAFVHEKLLYEDRHHNCVFVGLDDSGEAKHAHIRSTNTLPSIPTAGRSTATLPAAELPSSRCWNGCGRIRNWTWCICASTTMTRAMTPATV